MRRLGYAAVSFVVLTGGAAMAGPLDENQSHTVTPVRDAVRSVVVDMDSGSVVLRRSGSAAVDVVKRWTGNEPTLTVKVGSDGVLRVTGRCPGLINGPVVYAGGVGSCSTSVVVTLPAAAVDTKVTTNGDVTLSDFRGHHDLSTGYGTVTVGHTSGSGLQLNTNGGNVVLKAITSGSLTANSGSGAVSLTGADVKGLVSLSTNGGNVSATDLQADSLRSSSGSGNVTLTRARLHRAVSLQSNGGAVEATTVRAQQLTADSGSGPVTATDVSVREPLTLSTNGGNVTVRHAATPNLDLDTGSGDIAISDTATRAVKAHTNGGSVDVERTPAATFAVISGSGNVKIVTTSAPRSLKADTNGGNVFVTVARGTYALTLSQNGGQLVIDGITPDSRSSRSLDLSTGSGNISVLGR